MYVHLTCHAVDECVQQEQDETSGKGDRREEAEQGGEDEHGVQNEDDEQGLRNKPGPEPGVQNNLQGEQYEQAEEDEQEGEGEVDNVEGRHPKCCTIFCRRFCKALIV